MGTVLAERLHLLLPQLSARAHEALVALATKAGLIAGADQFARQLGFHNRHGLARLLQKEGLPPIEELCGWMNVLDLLYHYEQTHTSLYQLALNRARHPRTCYRTIKRIVGKTWTQARLEGFHFALIRFLQRCAELRARRIAVTRRQSPPIPSERALFAG